MNLWVLKFVSLGILMSPSLQITSTVLFTMDTVCTPAGAAANKWLRHWSISWSYSFYISCVMKCVCVISAVVCWTSALWPCLCVNWATGLWECVWTAGTSAGSRLTSVVSSDSAASCEWGATLCVCVHQYITETCSENVPYSSRCSFFKLLFLFASLLQFLHLCLWFTDHRRDQ